MSDPPKRHPFYFEDGTITFLVEGTLFRVHRYFLIRDSIVFRDMLAIPQPPGKAIEGVRDDEPIRLDGVKRADFARLLWVYYNPKIDDYTASIEEWSSILKLADMWHFENIRETALKMLGKMAIEAVTKIGLCHRHNIPRNWARDAFITLCKRAEPISSDEMASMGFENCAVLARAREGYIKLQNAEMRPSFQGLDDMSDGFKFATSIVRDLVQLQRPKPPLLFTNLS